MQRDLVIEDLDFEISPGGVNEPVLHLPVVVVAGVWIIVQETSPAQ